MNTPPTGYPIVALVAEIKADLKAHIQKDERDTAYIRAAQDEQSRELGAQTAMLSQLVEKDQRERRLSETRAKTAIESKTKLKANVWGWAIKGALGLLFTLLTILLGAWLHRKFGIGG